MEVKSLTAEQKATNFDTMQHIETVRKMMLKLIIQLMYRAHEHDQTKLAEPEVDLFVKYTPELAKCHYGSPEYQTALAGLKPALDHHYGQNRHHPEHFKNGINDMNLIDLIEMIVDWKAATLRQKDGNIRKSIELNMNRFGISPQLAKIMENTIELFEK